MLNPPDPIELVPGVWRKSSFCGEAACVEITMLQDGVGVRDSKSHSSPVLSFTHAEWGAFVAGVKSGEFDLS